jgi:hypothetical protein
MMTRFTVMWALTFLGVTGLAALVQDDPLRTRPERTNFEETSRLEDAPRF